MTQVSAGTGESEAPVRCRHSREHNNSATDCEVEGTRLGLEITHAVGLVPQEEIMAVKSSKMCGLLFSFLSHCVAGDLMYLFPLLKVFIPTLSSRLPLLGQPRACHKRAPWPSES